MPEQNKSNVVDAGTKHRQALLLMLEQNESHGVKNFRPSYDHMDLSRLLHGFVNVVTWIWQRCSMYFSPFAKQNQAVEDSVRTKGVE